MSLKGVLQEFEEKTIISIKHHALGKSSNKGGRTLRIAYSINGRSHHHID